MKTLANGKNRKTLTSSELKKSLDLFKELFPDGGFQVITGKKNMLNIYIGNEWYNFTKNDFDKVKKIIKG